MVVFPMPKVTFSLDEDTVVRLRQVAARTRKAQSLVVREAIAQYAACEPRLSEVDRERLLGVLRRIKAGPPTRPASEVDRELREIRRTRRTGWSRASG
jgi:predicted DNA-binding protein